MSFVSTRTIIPLARVAVHLGIDPYHFFQIYTSQRPANIPNCSDDWYQYSWQSSGKISREALARALRQAENMVVEYLHWSPIPVWIEEEVSLPTYYKTERANYLNSRNQAKSLLTSYGHVIETGQKAVSYIATPSVTFSDENGDGYAGTATITFNTTVTDEQELRVFYPNKNGDEHYEIRPLDSVSISGGVATIKFQRYLIPLESLIVRPASPDNPQIGIDGDDVNNFLTEVDVYRVYTDTSTQVTFYYEPGTNCGSDCSQDTDTGCLFIKDSRLGILGYSRADWDKDTSSFITKTFYTLPYKAKIYYRAGKVDNNTALNKWQMDQALERMIVFFALSFLDTKLCGCDNTRNIWQDQTRDLSVDNGDVRYIVPWSDLGNPFGTTFAAVRLWKFIQSQKLNRSPSLY